ncbi:YceI family protein [Hyphobacterium sp. CCMP332]|nr:YceI family protein [Hyphobacterium sp. CCMP332]
MISKRRLFLLIFFLAAIQIGFAQKTLRLNESSVMYVHGTSTLHDWTSIVEEMTATAEVDMDGELKDIKSLTTKIKVESIESGKGKMNDLTYEALKSEEHPFISFQLNDIKSIQSGDIIASGKLTIAGVTKNISVKGNYSLSGNKLKISGKKDINMTEFNIEPPTAMFGTIVVGEVVSIEYDLILN